MATAPNFVVAGHSGVARTLRETGWFPAVFEVARASELRDLSKSGQVGTPAAFMFAPGFTEDLPGAGIATLANGLAGSGFTVFVHPYFTGRGEAFTPNVLITDREIRLDDLLAALGIDEPPAPPSPPPAPPSPPGVPPPSPPPNPEPLPVPAPPPDPAAWSEAGESQGWNPFEGWSGWDAAAAPAAEQPAAEQPAAEQTASNGVAASGAEGVASAEPARSPLGRVIAVASAKGGVGKTSTTVNLSVHAARLLRAVGRDGSVVLVDTNFQQADVARYLNLAAPTVLDLFQAPGALTPETVRHHLARLPEIGLHALLGPPDAVSADPALINSALYRRILAVLRQTFDYVFIDTPVAELYHLTFADLILPEADAILVPVEPNRVTLEAAGAWLRAITTPHHSRSGGVDPAIVSLVLNRARADVDLGPDEVLDLMPGWRFVGMIPEDQAWTHAANTRRLTALELGPDLDATFRAILQAVTGDPAFGSATIAPPESRWKKMLGLVPK